MTDFNQEQPIIFFDGICVLCDRFVTKILARDRKGVYLFAPLQGETAARMLPDIDSNPLGWSIVLVDKTGTHSKSGAVLRIYAGLRGIYGMAAMGLVIPGPLRDYIYDLVARNRYRWFGKRESCRLPKPGEAQRFLP